MPKPQSPQRKAAQVHMVKALTDLEKTFPENQPLAFTGHQFHECVLVESPDHDSRLNADFLRSSGYIQRKGHHKQWIKNQPSCKQMELPPVALNYNPDQQSAWDVISGATDEQILAVCRQRNWRILFTEELKTICELKGYTLMRVETKYVPV